MIDIEKPKAKYKEHLKIIRTLYTTLILLSELFSEKNMFMDYDYII